MNNERSSASQYHQQFRRLDHLGSIQEGCGFTAIPDVLMDAYLNGDIPIAKFKLICVMLRHSAKFKIRRSYLSARFSEKTLQKYLPEIEADGFVRRERVPLDTGGHEVIYHTNRVECWRLYDDPSPGKPSAGKPSAGKPLKETKGKKTKEKKTKEWMDGCLTPKASSKDDVDVEPEQPAIQKTDTVSLCQRLEQHLDHKGFVDYRESIEWMEDVIVTHGRDQAKAFIVWLESNYERKAYLYTAHNRGVLLNRFLKTLEGNAESS